MRERRPRRSNCYARFASRLGVKWGCDGLGWWAVVKEIEFPTWAVWRQDDHGNSFLVEANLTQTQADELQAELEARGHKQTYWSANAASNDASSGGLQEIT